MSSRVICIIAAVISLNSAACSLPSETSAKPPLHTVKTSVSVQQTAALNKVMEDAISGGYAEHRRYRTEVVDKLETLIESGVLVPEDASSSNPLGERRYAMNGGKVFGIEVEWLQPSVDLIQPGFGFSAGPTIYSQTPLDAVLEKLSGRVPDLLPVKMSPGREQAYSASTGIFPRKGALAVGTVILNVRTFDAGASVMISSEVLLHGDSL